MRGRLSPFNLVVLTLGASPSLYIPDPDPDPSTPSTPSRLGDGVGAGSRRQVVRARLLQNQPLIDSAWVTVRVGLASRRFRLDRARTMAAIRAHALRPLAGEGAASPAWSIRADWG